MLNKHLLGLLAHHTSTREDGNLRLSKTFKYLLRRGQSDTSNNLQRKHSEAKITFSSSHYHILNSASSDRYHSLGLAKCLSSAPFKSRNCYESKENLVCLFYFQNVFEFCNVPF